FGQRPNLGKNRSRSAPPAITPKRTCATGRVSVGPRQSPYRTPARSLHAFPTEKGDSSARPLRLPARVRAAAEAGLVVAVDRGMSGRPVDTAAAVRGVVQVEAAAERARAIGGPRVRLPIMA